MENENNISGNIENTDTEPAETIKEDLTDRIKEKTEALMNVSETFKANKEENTDGTMTLPVELTDNKNEFIKRMILVGIYAVFFTFCLYKNPMGITFPLFTTATVVVYFMFLKAVGEKLKTFSFALIGFIELLGINVCITTSPVLITFDKIFIFAFFFVLFLYNLYDNKTWDASRYFLAITSTIATSIAYVLDPILDPIRISKNNEKKENKGKGKQVFPYVLLGLAISVPLLCVVLPLLLSSDIVFMETFRKIFSFRIDEDFSGIVFITLLIFFVGYALIKRLCARADWLKVPVRDKRNGNPVVSITISSVLLVFYGLYSAIQIIYLFLGFGTLPDGYTYADYAHEGFFQLVFVCLINLILVLVCRKYSKDSKALKVMLTLICVCTFIMLFSSAYRMILYIGVYGLTFLRVYVLWALTVIALAMTGTVILIYMEKMPFVKYSMAVIAVTWIIFAFSRPDTYIAEYNLSIHTGQQYVVEDLSDDAIPAIVRHRNDLSDVWDSEFIFHNINYAMDSDIRKFNFSKNNAYKALKKAGITNY